MTIPLEHQDTLKVSLVINLYDNGFSFDEQVRPAQINLDDRYLTFLPWQEVAYQYSRANQSVADTVNLGILPGQLDQILQRAERVIKEAAAQQAATPNATPGTPTGAPNVPTTPTGPPGSTLPASGANPTALGTPSATPNPTKPNQTPIVFYDGGIILEGS